MEALIGLGFLALVIGIIMVIVSAIRKKGLRTWGIVAGAGLVVLIIGGSLLPATPTATQPETPGVTGATTYRLSVTINPSGTGSVTPPGGEYESGVQVTLTASPAVDCAFDYWSGSASGTASTITITMDSDKTVTANFQSTAEPEPVLTPEIVMKYSATTASQIGVWHVAKSGHTYLIVDLDIENKGYESFSTNPLNFYVVVDRVRYSTAWVILDGDLEVVSLLDGGKTSGRIAFEVPQDVMRLGYELVYDSFRTYDIKWIEQ